MCLRPPKSTPPDKHFPYATLFRFLRNEFLVRLKEFLVLEPACGSGNFLYVALKALKDIEHRANIDAETLGLDKATPAVGPEKLLGIELHPYAAEMARVSVWIGELQCMRRNEIGRAPFGARGGPYLSTTVVAGP